jgi:hypothetical protein
MQIACSSLCILFGKKRTNRRYKNRSSRIIKIFAKKQGEISEFLNYNSVPVLSKSKAIARNRFSRSINRSFIAPPAAGS